MEKTAKTSHLGVFLHFYNNSNNLPLLYYHWCLEGLHRDYSVGFSLNSFFLYIVYIYVWGGGVNQPFQWWRETGSFRAQFIDLDMNFIFRAQFIGLGTGFIFKASLCISLQNKGNPDKSLVRVPVTGLTCDCRETQTRD